MTDDQQDLIGSAQDGNLLVFCGAGVSMLAPSNSPSWWEIYKAAATALCERFREGFPDFEDAIPLEELLAPLSTQQLADLIVMEFAGETFLELLRVVDVADPNENHRLIASMASNGAIKGVVTTNFDTLLERAAALHDETAYAVSSPGIALPDKPESTPLIKLHGTAVDANRMIETLSHKSRDVDPSLSRSWRQIVPGRDLLVIGYSGADLNFGAARAFFECFLEHGRRIWWLYRPGERPELIEPFQSASTMIEGSLPEQLRSIASAAGARDFSIPEHNRDAQHALDCSMRDWSRTRHIGRWAAASFLLSLASRHPEPLKFELYVNLLDFAEKKAERIFDGEAIDRDNMALPIFFGRASMQAAQHVQFERSALLARCKVNCYETIHAALEEAGATESYLERLNNLAGAWNNLGLTLLITGEIDDARASFARALEYSYLGGHTGAFLAALSNIAGNTLELQRVRETLRWVQAGVRLADRVGAVISSIELRLLSVMYLFDRNEIWSAATSLAEAARRAHVAGHVPGLRIAEALTGELRIRMGLYEEGLALLARLPRTAMLARPIEETRRYLESLSISHPHRFVIDLDESDVTQLSERIRQEVAEAAESERIPFRGAHCSVSSSSAVDQQAMGALFRIGVAEFVQDNQTAIECGIEHAKRMIDARELEDAAWTLENLVERPNLGVDRIGEVRGMLAHVGAELGDTVAVPDHLDAAVRACEVSGSSLPLPVADTGLWFSVQSGDVQSATEWARTFATLAARELPPKFLQQIAEALASWGEPMSPVEAAYRDSLSDSGISLPDTDPPKKPARRYTGMSAANAVDPDDPLLQSLIDIENTLEEDPKGALKELDRVLGDKDVKLSEMQVGLGLSLQVRAFQQIAGSAALNSSMDVQRKGLVRQLAFTALTRLEFSMLTGALSEGDRETASRIASLHAFVGEFSADRGSACDLLGVAAEISSDTSDVADAWRATRRYFGTARTRNDNRSRASAPQPQLIVPEFRAKLGAAECREDAEDAVTNAVSQLRAQGAEGRKKITVIRSDFANWALDNRHYSDARRHYVRAERGFRRQGDLVEALNAMAGCARAWSRDGCFETGEELFTSALDEAGDRPIRANLLLGLANAQQLEGTRDEERSAELRTKAIATYREAIACATLSQKERAMARLGLARALGENGDQEGAMQEFDTAIAELSHLGDPASRILIENRGHFEDGGWEALGLS